MSRANAFLITPVLLSAVLVLIPLDTRALGLGEARVDSFLNQPLDVRVRLLDAGELDLDSLTVRPASPEDFSRLGLTGTSLALAVEIVIDREQVPPVLRIRSARPVSDPVVQLLLDARWAGGRMLREYTLFLDPPTVAVAPPARSIAPSVEAPRPGAAERPDEPRQATAAARQRSRDAADRAEPSQPAGQSRQDSPRVQARNTSRARYGPVESGETLWSIARETLPADDLSMDQMMVAIVELNPNAFRNGNIHQLLRGAQLDLPDAERVRRIDRALATDTVTAQNRAFNQRITGDVPVVSDDFDDFGTEDTTRSGPADSADSADASEPEPEDLEETDDHRLALVPPTEEQGGAGSADGRDEAVASLRQRLARAEEELYAARQEAEAFEQRVGQLESLIESNPDGFGIRDADLAGLEQTLRAARAATGEDADPAMRAEVLARLDDDLEQFRIAGDASPDGVEIASQGGDQSRADASEPSNSAGQPDGSTQVADPEPAEQEPAGQEPAGQEPAEPVVTRVGGASQGWFDRV
ncbi:MAG: hypothetical protein LC637_12120, partial [Xanthomonadaceae bacterium]|nr:hypothetical protein [Xanthomonadaceae bacterium]